jgi:hypothetical protein
MFRSQVVILAVAVGGLSACVRADSAEFIPAKDNSIYQSSATADLSNGQGTSLFAGVTGTGSIRRGLLAFNMSTIPQGATITSVTLTMYLNRTAAQTEAVALHKVLADWGEGASNAGELGGAGAPSAPGDASWNYRFYNTARWSQVGGDFTASPSASTTISVPLVTYTWGSSAALVADVQSWVDHPGENFGWMIRGDETALGNAMRFDSREGTTPPRLSVTFTPPSHCGSADFNCDGDTGTDADIEAFFACLAGTCPAPPCSSNADFNGDGDVGTDADIEAFFRVLSGSPC